MNYKNLRINDYGKINRHNFFPLPTNGFIKAQNDTLDKFYIIKTIKNKSLKLLFLILTAYLQIWNLFTIFTLIYHIEFLKL